MNRRSMLLPLPSVLVAAALALTACGGSGSSSPGAEQGTDGAGASTPTTSESAGTSSGASSGAVSGVRLTADGSSLKVGDTATVSWQPDQKKTGVVAVKVTGLDRVSLSAFRAWRLTGPVLQSTPYYVHATVRNLGSSDLSGVAVPLYLLDKRNVLLQPSTFRAQFDACPSTPFPAHFTHGKKASVCLVYFAPDHGKLAAVSFRPTQDVSGITWRGPVEVPKAKAKTKAKKHQGA